MSIYIYIYIEDVLNPLGLLMSERRARGPWHLGFEALVTEM